MITKPSTFILGAGASANYGFPLGTQLIKDILNGHSRPNIYESFYFHKSHDVHLVNEFISALDKSAVTSIDSFLEHRKEFIDIGKFAIANVLLKCEQRSTGGNSNYKKVAVQCLNEDLSFASNSIEAEGLCYEISNFLNLQNVS